MFALPPENVNLKQSLGERKRNLHFKSCSPDTLGKLCISFSRLFSGEIDVLGLQLDVLHFEHDKIAKRNENMTCFQNLIH